ncbi:hypothetical protein QFZ32_000081 [Streptomyces canus]|nr:hypothetical protein [Streptomyces canus]
MPPGIWDRTTTLQLLRRNRSGDTLTLRQVQLTNVPMKKTITNVSKVSRMSSPATPSDREKIVSELPGWLRQNLKIRAAQHSIEIQTAVEQGISQRSPS